MSRYRNHPVRTTVAALSASALAMAALVACSSSSSTKSGSTAASSSSTQKFSGSPIKVQINTAVGTQFGSYPGSIAAVKAAARAVNATGGINGHEVQVESCNTQLNPNQEVACARSSVSNGAVATISSLILTSGKDYLATLAKAGIADIGSEVIQPIFAQAPNSYGVEFDVGAFAPCTGQAITKLVGGNRVIAIYPDIPASAPLKQFIQLGTAKQGTTFAGSVPIPATVTDYAPYIQQIAALKPDVVVFIGGPAQVAALLQAANLAGRKLTVCSPVASNISPSLVSAGAAASSFYLAQAMPPLSAVSQIPALKTFQDQMGAELAAGDKDADISGTKGSDPNELQTWVAMEAFIQAAKNVTGAITAQSVQASLAKLKFSSNGIVPDIDFSKPLTAGPFTRIYNPYFQLQKWNPTAKQFELLPNTQIDTAKTLFGYAK